ncbi:MAG TPA: SDR family oxidoreductase [Ktedonobacteraceae bacterium]
MEKIDMQGKICLVTGSSSGIGEVTARELARQGATVVMVCRNRTKGARVQQEIQAATGNANVDLLIADLASLSDVQRLAGEFKQKYTRLHVLIQNAGGVSREYKLTPEGYEMTFVVNYLAPFLLTQLLLDVLKASAPARIINVSSLAHTSGQIDFADLQGEKKYSTLKAYSQAKLALILFTYELARQLQGSGVTVNVLHPGVIASNFAQGLNGFMRVGWRLISPFLSSVEKGAQTTLYLATSPAVEGVSGKYFSNSKETPSSSSSYNEPLGQQLWQVSEALIRVPA